MPRSVRALALLVLFLSLASSAAVAQDSAPSRPNVVLIVADDLGYGETGVQGGRDVPTPNIDSLAASGIRFTNGYVSCPVCAPTRAGLQTGRYQQRFGFEHNPGPEESAEADFGLPTDEKTLAERLKPLGYATGMFGKWHLGYDAARRPTARGFDEFFGFLSGGHAYQGRSGRGNSILRGTEPVDEPEYLTKAFAREAAAFVERNKDRPFFLYLPFNAVHAPLQAAEEYLARVPDVRPQRRRTFAAMLLAMDDGVGLVLAKLREHGLEERTLVVFVSDNGGPTEQTTSSNDPLRGAKGSVHEGGIRVPFFVQWKGRLGPGTVYPHPVIALDVVPTVLAAVGSPAGAEERLDGVDLLPYLTGRDGRPHEALYWRFGDQSAIRKGDWKLVRARGDSEQLFDLAKDPGETEDLIAKEPEKANELAADWSAWSSTLEDPKWKRNARKGR